MHKNNQTQSGSVVITKGHRKIEAAQIDECHFPSLGVRRWCFGPVDEGPSRRGNLRAESACAMRPCGGFYIDRPRLRPAGAAFLRGVVDWAIGAYNQWHAC